MTLPTISKKSVERAEIASEVEAFLNGGGKIEEVGQTKIVDKVFLTCPNGVTTESVQDRQARKKKAALRGARKSAISRKPN